MNIPWHPTWQKVLKEETDKSYFKSLQDFLQKERRTHTIYPPEEEVFTAFYHTLYDQVRVLILGQDPYHDDGLGPWSRFLSPTGRKTAAFPRQYVQGTP